jgi:RNA polymerase sigma factor FliA
MTPRAQYAEQTPSVDELIESHLNLVKKIAWHTYGRVRSAIEIDDLVQIGYFGLITAAQKYTPQEGATFASYASLRIRGAMMDHLRKNSNLCRTTIQIRQKANKVEKELTQKLGHVPDDTAMAAAMEMSISDWLEWQSAFAANTHESLDSVYDDYSIWFASSTSSPEDNLSDTDLRNTLKEALVTLPEREALVIQLFYVEELNIYEIAEILEVSTGRVSQIKKAGITRLRDFITESEKEI